MRGQNRRRKRAKEGRLLVDLPRITTMSDELSDYERQRAENMQRNAALLLSLGLSQPLVPRTSSGPSVISSAARKRRFRVSPAGEQATDTHNSDGYNIDQAAQPRRRSGRLQRPSADDQHDSPPPQRRQSSRQLRSNYREQQAKEDELGASPAAPMMYVSKILSGLSIKNKT